MIAVFVTPNNYIEALRIFQQSRQHNGEGIEELTSLKGLWEKAYHVFSLQFACIEAVWSASLEGTPDCAN